MSNSSVERSPGSADKTAAKAKNNEKLSKYLDTYAIYLILLLMIIVMSILKPDNFPKLTNFTNIMRQMTPIGIMALGVTFCIITAGTDLSGGSVLALCSVVAAHLAHPGPDGSGVYPLAVTILGTMLVGGFAGVINGVVIAYGKVPPFIATLGMMSMARGAAMLLSGGRPIGNFTEPFKYLGGGIAGKVLPVPVIIFALCAVVSYIILHRSKFGTYVYATGGNENAAKVSGIQVNKILVMVYMLAGMTYGIAAIVLTARQESGIPSVGLGYDMEAITCAIIGGSSFSGGIGTIGGTVVGALIMGVLANGMTMMHVNPNWQTVVKGAVIVAAVLFDMRKNRSK